jgi:SOS response regulatory protein OraA/RecX
MASCSELAGYAELVARVRANSRAGGLSLDRAVEAAVDSCIAEGILGEYLMKRRAEATDMMLTEFDEEREMALLCKEWREDGWREGREAGLEEGRRALAEKLVQHGFDADELERIMAEEQGEAQSSC